MSQLTPLEIIKLPEMEERFSQLAPVSMSYQAEASFATQILLANRYLFDVAQQNPQSLKSALSNVAAIGLTLNPAEKQAYLLPRDGVVCLDPSYVGLIRIATDSGSIKWVQANIVREQDQFTDNGAGEKPTHSYQAFAKPEDRGLVVGVYCVAKTDDGDYLTTVMPMDEIASIRDRSEMWRRKKRGPWVTDFNEQAKKSVIRRAFKTWPRSVSSDRMALAVDISNQNEGFEPIVNAPDAPKATNQQKLYFDGLIEDQNALEMFVFSKTIPVSELQSLYNSFPRGQIGKYKQITTDLINRGMSECVDWVAQLTDSPDLIETVIESEAQTVVDYIISQLPADVQLEIHQYMKAEADSK